MRRKFLENAFAQQVTVGAHICVDISYVVLLYGSTSFAGILGRAAPHNLHTWLISNSLQGVSQMFDQLVKRSNWIWIYKTGRFAESGVLSFVS